MEKFNKSNYPESDLTKMLIRCAFEVYNELGFGHPEKTYQNAYEESLSSNKIEFKREKYSYLTFNNKRIGKYYLDFLIENKVAVETKVRNDIYETDIKQLLGYLKSENLKIGLLLVFTKHGVLIKRIIN